MMKKLKTQKLKLLYLWLSLIMLITGCGCTIETPNQHNKRIEEEALNRSEAFSQLLSSNEASISLDNTAATEPSNEDFLSETTGYTLENTDMNTVKTEENTTSPYILVHITVTCSQVINHKELNTKALIPDNGIFLDTYVAVKAGSSVYDALETALTDNNMSFSQKAGYITGICNLNEKECGKYSGWKYSVNSVYGNVGCNDYTLSDGDNILWGYVASFNDTY